MLWTFEEFKQLENRLLEQELGYKITILSGSRYLITQKVKGKIDYIAEYDRETGILYTKNNDHPNTFVSRLADLIDTSN